MLHNLPAEGRAAQGRPRCPLSTRLVNRYIARLHRTAEFDATVAVAFMRVAAMLDPKVSY